MKELFIIALALLTTALVYGQGEAPLVTISDGQLKGTANLTVKEHNPYYAYRGIPYAKKPLGDLRFAPPVKNDPWTGILDATRDKDSCTQMGSGLAIGGSGVTIIGSEDCLYINVYTTNVNGNLPVMVWIYGGGFSSGTSSYDIYGPDYLLEKDVIYVAFNYRLGIFGFLSTEDSAASGNWGLKDQVLALKWVKENIKHFGGDPNKVTIFGQSAGSASVSYLIQSDLTTGLYQGAIMESGTSLCLWALTRNARQKAFNVGLRLGIITLSSKALINNLRRMDYKALKLAENNVTTQSLLTENILAGLPFGVVTEPDDPGAVFSGKSWQQLSIGKFGKVPLLVGATSNEAASLTAYVDVIRPILFQYEFDVPRFAPFDLTQNWFKRLLAGSEIRGHYFGLGSLSSQPIALTRFITVDQFERPIREFVNQASKFSKVYFYQFSYKGLLGDPTNSLKGVGHAEELIYLFVTNNRTVNERDSKTIDRFVTLWTNFAKTGNPTPSSGSGSGSVLGELAWEPNDSSTDTNTTIKYLNINDTLAMSTNPFQSDWAFYEGIYDQFGDPPYTTY